MPRVLTALGALSGACVGVIAEPPPRPPPDGPVATIEAPTTAIPRVSRRELDAHLEAVFGIAGAASAHLPADPAISVNPSNLAEEEVFDTLAANKEPNPVFVEGLETLEFGAFLHDIGKIGIKDAVLLKPGPLDDAEWLHMREHPVKGYEIASKIEMLKPIIGAVRNHHERWDGSGYPDKMVGEDIPLAARIVAIADAYDAMTSDRAYRRALQHEVAVGEIERCAGTQFDPELADAFVKLIEAWRQQMRERGHDSLIPR